MTSAAPVAGVALATPLDGRPRPRIGVDFHTFDGIFQGSRSHLVGVYAEAVGQAPELDFVLLLAEPERLRREHPVFDAPNVRLATLPPRGGVARLGWQLAAAQRRQRLDLLHLQYRLPLLAAGPCACTIHDTLFESHPHFFGRGFVRMSRLTSRHAVRRAALLFTVSAFSRDEIVRLYGADAGRITITGNGVDRTRFCPADWYADGDATGRAQVAALGLVPDGYLCTVGRIEPRKNHLNLLRAYALLPAPRLPLVIVGQRDAGAAALYDAVQAEVVRLEVGRDVRFLPSVGDAALPALLRHARLFAYPSHAEGFGMPVVEAMASGVPVVTSNGTALPEVTGDAAAVVDPDAPADIAHALQALLGDPTAWAAARQRGLAQASKFTWAASAAGLVGAYRRYFARHRAARAPVAAPPAG